MSSKLKSSPVNVVPTFIHYCFYSLFFITPLLLWPFTSEVFEFNKMLFVYLMTVLISAGWLIRALKIKRLEFARTPLDLPILLFLTTQILSTVFSIDRHTSLWGYYSRFHGGLVSTVSYTLLYYALVTHFTGYPQALKNLLKTLLATAAITSIYAVMEKMGVDKNIWVQDVQSRVFSTLGQPNWLSAYLIALLPISLFASARASDTTARRLYLGLTLLFLLAIFFTKSQSGLGATGVVLTLSFITLAFQKKRPQLLFLLPLFFILLLIFKGDSVRRTLHSLNKINPFYSDSLTIITEENRTRIGGSDSMAIRRVVWQGALELGRRYPFFGTGVETFGYSYYWVRPAAHNLTSESEFLYNKAHNEYLNFLATTGFTGLFAYLFLIGAILYLFLRRPENELRDPLLLGFLSILITNYFGFSVVNIALFFFLFPAIYLAHTGRVSPVSIPFTVNEILAVSLIYLLAFSLILGVRRQWLADLAYTRGRSNLELTQKAIQLNPREPLYYAQLGHLQSLVATQIIAPQMKDLTGTGSAELRQKAQTFLNQYTTDALRNTSLAVQMNPWHLNLLKIKARTELTLATLDPQYFSAAVQSMLKLIELSPQEATNYYNLGVIYSDLAKTQNNSQYLDLAQKFLLKAIDLKPDFETAKHRLQEITSPSR